MKNTKESISTLSGRIDAVQKEQDFNRDVSRFWIRLLSFGVVLLFIGFYCLYYANKKKNVPTVPQFVTCVICKHAVGIKFSTSIPVAAGMGETFTARFCEQHAPSCDRITTPMATEAHALEWRDFWQYEKANAAYRRVNSDGSEFDPPKPRVITEVAWIYTNRPTVTNTIYVTNSPAQPEPTPIDKWLRTLSNTFYTNVPSTYVGDSVTNRIR